MKVLVIEDEPQMLENIQASLKHEDYIVETATDFETAMQKTGLYDYDCILLDITLPGGDGLEILQELKNEHKTDGVIIISAKDSLEDRIKGLEMGADDYLAKPFHMSELNARIKAVLRRRKFEGNSLVEINNIIIDPEQKTLQVKGIEVALNRKEFAVLLYMAVNKNKLVNKTAIAENVWGDYIDEANSLDFIYSQVKNLRKKLKDAGADIEIQAIYGVGYKLLT